MISKILVAIDESASSEWAFDTALTMAGSLKADLLLVHILDSFSPDSPQPPCVSVDSFLMDRQNLAQSKYEQRWQQVENRYDRLLQSRQADAEAAGVVATHLQERGMPAQKICEAAKKNGVDLIVVGNRDRTNQNSISNYLVHHAPCSVTVVHPKTHYEAFLQTDVSSAVAV